MTLDLLTTTAFEKDLRRNKLLGAPTRRGYTGLRRDRLALLLWFAVPLIYTISLHASCPGVDATVGLHVKKVAETCVVAAIENVPISNAPRGVETPWPMQDQVDLRLSLDRLWGIQCDHRHRVRTNYHSALDSPFYGIEGGFHLRERRTASQTYLKF